MRLATMASIAVLAASSAALAQVAGSPVEQKAEPSNAAAPSAKDSDGLDNSVMPAPGNAAASPAGNSAPAPERSPTPRRR